MNKETLSKFFAGLDEKIQAKHLLKHELYLAWTQGTLKREVLQDYAKEYYHHVKAFPTYLSALHAQTDDAPTRKGILQNLIEEEAGCPNHPDLWRSFALHVGVKEEELAEHTPCVQIQNIIDTFRSICSNKKSAEGLAALYAYESQIPAICVSKIEGLKKHYGMSQSDQWRYFSVHIAADEEHARMEKELLARHISDEGMQDVYIAAERVLDGLWDFLTHLCQKWHVCSSSRDGMLQNAQV